MPGRGRNQAGRAIVIRRVDSVRRQPIRQLDRCHHEGMYIPIAIYWQSTIPAPPPGFYYIPIRRTHFRYSSMQFDSKDISECKFSAHSSVWNQVSGDSDSMPGARVLSESMPPNTGVSALRLRKVRARIEGGCGQRQAAEGYPAGQAANRLRRPMRLRRCATGVRQAQTPIAPPPIVPTRHGVRYSRNELARGGGARAEPRRICPQIILGMMVR